MPYRDQMSRTVGEREAGDARLQHALASAESACAGSAAPKVELALDAALWESQAALARSEERLSLASAALGFLAWWDWEIPTDRFFASASFAKLTGIGPGMGPAAVPFSTYLNHIHPEDRGWVRDRITRDMAGGGEFSEDFRVCLPEGLVRWLHARGRFVLDRSGRPERFSGVAIDISERKAADLRKDALLALGEALREIDEIEAIARTTAQITASGLGAPRASFGMVDAVGEIVEIVPAWPACGSAMAARRSSFRDFGDAIDDLRVGKVVVIADCRTDGRPLARMLLDHGTGGLVAIPLLVSGTLTALVLIHDAPPRVRREANVFLQSVADRAQAALARVQADAERRMLNNELSHRLKNSLALVQSIASQTLRNAPDKDTARDALSLRLIALGKAHDILLAGRRDGADLAEIVEGALTLHADEPERIRVTGPSLQLGPSAALSLSLILHELATNAVKYGALSNETGRITVEWTTEGGYLRLLWREVGGPSVTPPSRKGFGTRLIERGLVGGEVRTAFEAVGLTCQLTTLLGDVGAAR